MAIAYQTVGSAPADLVFVRGFAGDLLSAWDQPLLVRFIERLSEFARVIMLDKRGTGLSDRVREVPTLETRMDDVRAVLDDLGSERAAVWTAQEGARLAALFAPAWHGRAPALGRRRPGGTQATAAAFGDEARQGPLGVPARVGDGRDRGDLPAGGSGPGAACLPGCHRGLLRVSGDDARLPDRRRPALPPARSKASPNHDLASVGRPRARAGGAAGHSRPSMSLDVYSHVMPADEIADERFQAVIGA